MRVLTVRQPWAWAIFHGKDVENRTQLWKYRGPVAIHAGAQISDRGHKSRLVGEAIDRAHVAGENTHCFALSRIIGVVDLVDVHPALPGCCESPWAEYRYAEAGGKIRSQIAHLVLENPIEFPAMVLAKGRLGLWTPDVELAELIDHAKALVR